MGILGLDTRRSVNVGSKRQEMAFLCFINRPEGERRQRAKGDDG
jgi:hypothetical protein